MAHFSSGALKPCHWILEVVGASQNLGARIWSRNPRTEPAGSRNNRVHDSVRLPLSS